MTRLVKFLKKRIIGSVLFVGLLIALTTAYLLFLKGKKPTLKDKHGKSRNQEQIDLLISQILRKMGFNGKAIQNWIAVAHHETDLYRSNLARNHNNLFGMKYPDKRARRPSTKTKSGFASYKILNDSILDVAMWAQHVGLSKTPLGLVDQMKSMVKAGWLGLNKDFNDPEAVQWMTGVTRRFQNKYGGEFPEMFNY